MQTIPSGTQFVGFNPEVNMTDKKSAVVNKYQQAFSIQELASGLCNPLVINTDGKILELNTIQSTPYGQITNGSTGIIPVSFYFAVELNLTNHFYLSSLPTFIDIEGALYVKNLKYETNSTIESFVSDDTIICFENCFFVSLSELTELSLFSLQQFSRFKVDGCDLLESIYLPSFKYNTYESGDSVIISNNANLQTVNIPDSVSIYNIAITGNPLLTDVVVGTIGTLKSSQNYNQTSWLFNDNALSVSCVDSILALLVSLDGTNGTTLVSSGDVDLSGGTNAPPSAAGLADKAILEGRGLTVTVNVAP